MLDLPQEEESEHAEGDQDQHSDDHQRYQHAAQYSGQSNFCGGGRVAERVVKVRLLAQVTDYEKGMLAAAQATRAVGTEAEKLEQKKQAFEQVGRGLVLTGAALTAVTALSVKAALDWESAWAGVTKTVDGNAEQMGELEDGLRSLAQTLPATHDEIAAVAEAAGQLGVQRESIVAFTKTMVDLSETTNLTADEASTSIAQLMNVMQTAPDDVDNLGSALVALGNDGASTERDIVQMAQRIAGAGKTVGLTEAQVLGFANALSSVGIEAEAGGSAISRIMTDIAMSVSAGGKELDQFAQVAGMSSTEFQKAFKEAPADAIASFIEGLGRINATGGDVFKTLSDLGQTDIRVSQALLGMANSGDLLRKSLDLGSAAWSENTALAVEAAKRYETTEAKIQIAGNAVRDAAIDFGDVFLPAVGAAAEGVAQFAQFMGDLPDPVQGVLGVLTSTVGMLALAGGAALLAVPKWAAFKVAVDNLGLSMKTIGLVGGGAILALTALVTVVGAVASAQAQAAARAEAYADTLAEGTNKITDATREMAVANLSARDSMLWWESMSAYDEAEKLGIAYDLVTEAALGDAAALKELQKQLEAGKAAHRDSKTEAEAYAQNTKNLTDAIVGESTSLERAVEIAEQQQKAQNDSASSAETAAEAYTQASDAVGELTDNLSSLIDKINEANGVGQDAVSANAQYQQALGGLNEQVERNGASLDQATVAGSANAAALADLAGRAQDAAAAQFEQDKATMSSKDATERYAATLSAQRQAFIDSATAAGFNRDEVVKLADQVFKLPSEKEIQILAETDTADEKLRLLKQRLDAIPGYKRITLESFSVGRFDVTPNEDGNLYTYKAFANGGMSSGIYPGGAEIHKFAERTLPWEAYISPKSDQRQQNYGTWMEVGSRLGFSQPQSAQVASGPSFSFTGDMVGLDPKQIAYEVDKQVRRANTVAGVRKTVGD